MPGGFTGAGGKTVIPAKASAKISMRMVPNQNPDDILEKFTKYVKSITPKGIQISIKLHSKGKAVVVSTDNDYIKAANKALHEVFHKETVYIRTGGSIPIVGQFRSDLKIPTVMMGLGLPDDNLHAPNEKFHIPNFYKGIESVVRFLAILGK
jgi:acetylornithine deacetylase/succinyl-diaminopimelate desuccinylase-like protein